MYIYIYMYMHIYINIAYHEEISSWNSIYTCWYTSIYTCLQIWPLSIIKRYFSTEKGEKLYQPFQNGFGWKLVHKNRLGNMDAVKSRLEAASWFRFFPFSAHSVRSIASNLAFLWMSIYMSSHCTLFFI